MTVPTLKSLIWTREKYLMYAQLAVFVQGKREKVSSLRELNTEAEKRKSFGALISEDFQKKYDLNYN